MPERRALALADHLDFHIAIQYAASVVVKPRTSWKEKKRCHQIEKISFIEEKKVNEEKTTVSRRHFLKGSMAAGASALVAASCAQATPPPANVSQASMAQSLAETAAQQEATPSPTPHSGASLLAGYPRELG